MKKHKILAFLLLFLLIFQSVPMKAYALDNETNTNNESQDPSYQIVDEQIKETQTQVETTQDAIVDLAKEAEKLKDTSEIDVQGGTPLTQEKIDETIAASNINTLESANNDLSIINTNIENADKNKVEVKQNITDSKDETVQIVNNASKIEQSVNDTKKDVDDLLQNIENAQSAQEVNDYYEQLDKKINESELSLEEQKEAFEKLQNTFNTTIGLLANSKTGLDSELQKASDNSKLLEEKISTIQTQINTLDTKTNDVIGALDDDKQVIQDVNNGIEEAYKTGTSWEKARKKMYVILENYYIPQYVDENATDFTFTYTRGFDLQDYNYNTVTYKDKDGETHTMYFNYDLVDKEDKGNRYKNLGTSKQIVIYEKTIEEINADAYLKEYFKNEKMSNNQINAEALAGNLDVFSYKDGDTTVYMVRKELTDAITAGTVTTDADGNYIINDKIIKEVVQNKNSKVKNGEYALDEQNDIAYNEFLTKTNELYGKFETYEIEVSKAKGLVNTALTEATTLKETVNSLQEEKSKLKVQDLLTEKEMENITSILGNEDVVLFKAMTVEEAIVFLNKLVDESKQKVNNAILNYTIIKKQRDDTKEKLDEIIKKFDKTEDTSVEQATNETASDVQNVVQSTYIVTTQPQIPVVQTDGQVADTNQQTIQTPAVDNGEELYQVEEQTTPLENITLDDNKPVVYSDEISAPLENIEVPLANQNLENARINLMLLVLLLIAVTIVGFVLYRKNKI